MKALVLILATLGLTIAKPNGFYHQEYNYQTSSSSYKNNELQHKNQDEGYYSKDGDLEGRLRPKVNAHSQHSEYVNPKLRNSFDVGQISSFGQLNDQSRLRDGETIFDGNNQLASGGYTGGYGLSSGYQAGATSGLSSGYQAASSSGLTSGYQAGSSYQNYGMHSNLQQVTHGLQEELARQLQQAVYNQHRRTSGYSSTISHAQAQSDLRELEEELRRNVTMRLQDALRTHYGNQGIRGGYSYSIQNGRLQSTANYDNQELTDLTRQIEANLMRQLEEQMRSYYHTQVSRSMNTQHSIQQPIGLAYQPVVVNPEPVYPHYPQNVQVATHQNHVSSRGESITTVATRVQNDLNEHLNRILDDTQRRYFSTNAYRNNAINFDNILTQLQRELRSNITLQFENEIRRNEGYGNYAQYKLEDLENLKRQIESNLITKLNRDFNKQRERYYETYTASGASSQLYESHHQQQQHDSQPVYYQSNGYNSNFQQHSDLSAIQRQLQENLSRQLQAALLQNQYRQSYAASSSYNPQANYQATLQQLTAELNRNLTRQLEQSLSQYGSGQEYQSSGYNAHQLANLRSQLQNDLQRQLQQGLQQSYSRYSSWSSSSSTNYRPVRGFDPNLYQSYGMSSDLTGGNEDCMMGDDPSAYQQQTQDDDLTQQTEDLTQQSEDLTQQSEDLTQQSEDLTQQSEDLTQQSEDLTKPNEDIPTTRPALQTSGSYGQHLIRVSQQRHEDSPRYTSTMQWRPSPQVTVTSPGIVRQRVRYFESSNGSPSQITRTYHYSSPITQQQTVTHDGTNYHSTDYRTREFRIGHHVQQPLTYQSVTRQYPENSQQTQFTYRPYQNVEGNSNIYKPGGQYSQHRGYRVRPIDVTQQTEENTTFGKSQQQEVEVGQEVEDSDSTQQTQNINHGKLLVGQQQQLDDDDLTQQTQNLQQVEDLTQQTQDVGYGKIQIGNQQQVEDSHLNQQTHNIEYEQLQSGSQSRRPQTSLGQQVEDSDFPQQSQHLGSRPQRPLGQHRVELGQQVEDSQLTQQTEDVGYGKLQIGSQSQQPQQHLTQQVDDSDLTQQTEDVGYGKLQTGSQSQQPQQHLTQQVDDSDLTQQTQDIDYEQSPSQPIRPQRPLSQVQIGQQVEDFHLAQQNLESQTEYPEQVDDLNQQTQDYHQVQSQPQRPLSQVQLGQQVEDSQLTQQTEDVGYGKLQSGSQQHLVQQVDDSDDLTQQTQDIDYGKLQSESQPWRPQRPASQVQIGQQVESSRSTQNHGKLQIGSQTQTSLPQQVDDSDLSQQTQEIDYQQLQSGSQSRQPQKPLEHRVEFGQQVEDLTQQTQDVGLGKLQAGQYPSQPQTSFNQHADDLTQQNVDYGGLSEFGNVASSDLTQQTEDVNLGQPEPWQPQSHLNAVQQVDNTPLTQQTLHVANGKLQSQSNIDTSDLTQQTQKIHSGGFEPEGSDFTQQTQNANDLDIGYSRLHNQQNIDQSDLAQQAEDQHLKSLVDLTHPGHITQQQVEDSHLLQHNQKPQTTRITYYVTRQRPQNTIQSQSNTVFTEPQVPQQTDDSTQQQEVLSNTDNSQSPQGQSSQQTLEAQRQADLLIEKLREKVRQNSENSQTSYTYHSQPPQISHSYHTQAGYQGSASSVPETQQSVVLGPLDYKPQPVYSGGQQVGTTRQISSGYGGRTVITPARGELHYGTAQQVVEDVETATEIEEIEPQHAHEVQQVVGVKTAGHVEVPPEVEEIPTTTPKPGFWRRVGNTVRDKANALKEKIG